MRKLFVLSAATLLLLVPLLFSTGCAPQSKQLGRDWYMGVPLAEHERRFPKGHEYIPGANDENCVFSKSTNSYFCQFDWSESGK